MSEENKRIARRVIERLWNKDEFELAEEIVALDYIEHLPGDETHGLDGVRQYFAEQRLGFPDIHYTVNDQVAEGDKVVTRWTARGTHQGEFKGMPATGKQGRLSGITISRIADGKLIEGWTSPDELSLMQQLGAIPGLARESV
jgi:steroid delta-isomerase-like uncharacterized protein